VEKANETEAMVSETETEWASELLVAAGLLFLCYLENKKLPACYYEFACDYLLYLINKMEYYMLNLIAAYCVIINIINRN